MKLILLKDGDNTFSKLLLGWSTTLRNFPWRQTSSPYHVLIAEILLQRTRAEQVVPTYLNFISRWPDMRSLSTASQSDLHSIIGNLGLNYRSKRLLEIAREICEKFSCDVPHDYISLVSLSGKGVGKYARHAVLCFGFGDRTPIVDSNVVRIFARVFSLQIGANSHRRTDVWLLAESLLPGKNKCKEYNWRLIDLGALICTPDGPKCKECPLLSICDYGNVRVNPKQSTL